MTSIPAARYRARHADPAHPARTGGYVGRHRRPEPRWLAETLRDAMHDSRTRSWSAPRIPAGPDGTGTQAEETLLWLVT
jgi:hypothetical protein